MQILANALPDFLVQRLQDYQQGQKNIYRKLNLVPVLIGNGLKLAAWTLTLSGFGLAAQRLGWLDGVPFMKHRYVVALFDFVSPVLYGLPFLVLVLAWGARYAMSHSYIKVQKDD
jgi:hypothetical protein